MADAYLLYFFAAREGHAASALALGTQADPAQYNPQDSVFDAPDIIQAHKWYQAAAQNGNAQGRERLADLLISEHLALEVLADHAELGAGGTCFSLTHALMRILGDLGYTSWPAMADMTGP